MTVLVKDIGQYRCWWTCDLNHVDLVLDVVEDILHGLQEHCSQGSCFCQLSCQGRQDLLGGTVLDGQNSSFVLSGGCVVHVVVRLQVRCQFGSCWIHSPIFKGFKAIWVQGLFSLSRKLFSEAQRPLSCPPLPRPSSKAAPCSARSSLT